MRLVFFSGLTYAEIPGFRPLLLDLHVPDDTTVGAGAAGIPVVVWIHGGGFTSETAGTCRRLSSRTRSSPR